MTFINGGNLFAAFKHLDVFVDDYDSLFHCVFQRVVERWRGMFVTDVPVPAQHVSALWYVVDAIDEWDLKNPKTRQHLHERFLDDPEVRARWVAEAKRAESSLDLAKLEQRAVQLCLDDLREWYEKKASVLHGMSRFHHAVESASDYVKVRRNGRWKVDLLHKTITEKGIDAAIAADMLGMTDAYDVAIVVAGDPDGIPGLHYLQQRGKLVASVELLKGHPSPESRVKFASSLRLVADIVTPVYESELVELGMAKKGGVDKYGLRE